MTVELYNPKDKSEVRDKLLREQGGRCALTKLPLDKSQSVTDHAHDDEMFVRGVISRSSNSLLGVIENGYRRYMAWWYSGTLPDFLRQCAEYLERPKDTRYRHDQWLKKLGILYNTLNEAGKKEVLQSMNQHQGNNATERKALFRKALLTKKFTYEDTWNLINETKGK